MLTLVVRRILAAVPILLGVLLVAQLLLDFMPGDPAAILAGEHADPEVIARFHRELHLDEPVWQRFGRYVWDVVHGNLGRTPGSPLTVWQQVSPTLSVTLSLALVALIFAVIVGVAAGTVAARRKDKFADRAVTTVASVMLAAPPFCVGLAFVVVFAVQHTWLPAGGYVALTDSPWEWLRHLILPGVTLGLFAAAELARQTRGSLVDTFEHDFVRALRAKGLPERSVVAKHAAKNAATPVVTVLGLQVGRIIGGAIVVELIFALPGFGTLALNAVLGRDLVLIQGVVLISAIAVLLSNLLVDVAYAYLNPRTRT
jgi:peptide/nickel transport system permease protein